MLSADEVRKQLAAKCQEVGSETAWAKAHGLSQPYVNHVISGMREPGAAILRALGLRCRKVYEPIEGAAE